jgi:hypothetical protein
MARKSGLRLSLLSLPILLLPQSAANAATTLAEAVREADAKYLEAPDVQGEDTSPKIEAGGGEEAGAATQQISQGGVKAVLSYAEQQGEDGEIRRSPIVTIFARGKEVAKLEGGDTGFADPPVSVQIAELDPGNSLPEVVVSFYTGGAHCCSATNAVTASPDGASWTVVDVGEFDGGPLLATDLNGDGRYEFATRDNSFLYAFACYACSEAPLLVLGLKNGAVEKIGTDPSFKPAHASWLKTMIGNVPEDDVNGFLAGYVGEKILLGEGKQGWELMLAYYDRASEWGLDACDQPLNQDGECPGQEIKLTFPDALERMLKENGYKVEK